MAGKGGPFAEAGRGYGVSPGVYAGPHPRHPGRPTCAAAEYWEIPIFTTDGDFKRFAIILPVRLHTQES